MLLNNEFKKRYNKQQDHLTIQKLGKILADAPKKLPVRDQKEPTPAMPDECKVPGDSIQSYHNYYWSNKKHLWSWKGKINSRERPRWLSNMMLDKLHETNVELGLIY